MGWVHTGRSVCPDIGVTSTVYTGVTSTVCFVDRTRVLGLHSACLPGEHAVHYTFTRASLLQLQQHNMFCVAAPPSLKPFCNTRAR